MRRALHLAPLTVALVCGCVLVNHTEYPRDWPAPAGRRRCPDVSGEWRDRSDEDPFAGERRLSVLLAGDPVAPVPPAGRIRIIPTAGGLDVVSLSASGAETGRAAWREGKDYSCTDGWMVHRRGVRGGNANVCVDMESLRSTLAVDGLGFLIVNDANQDICIGFVGALFAWEAHWYRFRPVAPAASVPENPAVRHSPIPKP